MTSTPASSDAFPSPSDEPLPVPSRADAPTGAIRTGHCLCGRVAYRVAGDPFDPHLCSCPHETRLSGGPAVLWVGFPTESLSWTGPGGEPKWYSTHPTLRRGFCPDCGTHLVSVADGSDMIMVTGFSLTDRRGIEPLGHSYRESSVPWMRVALAPAPPGPALRPRSS